MKDPWDCYIPEYPPDPDAVYLLTQVPADDEESEALDKLWDELVSSRRKDEMIRKARITAARKNPESKLR